MKKIIGFWEDETINQKTKQKMLKKIEDGKKQFGIVFPLKLTLEDIGTIIETLMHFDHRILNRISDEIIRQVSHEEEGKILNPVVVYTPYMISKMDREKKLENWKRIWEMTDEELKEMNMR